MMTSSRSLLSMSVVALIAAGAAVGAAVSASADSGSVRYASPHGSGSACSAAKPCALLTAVNHSGSATQVVMRSGNYGSTAHPLTTTIEGYSSGLVIHGIVGKSRPVIHTSAAIGVELQGSTLSNVRVDSSGTNSAVLALKGVVTHTIAFSSGSGAAACAVYQRIVDSLCVATGLQGVALVTISGEGGLPINKINVVVRGVTAESTDPTGYGLLASSGAYTAIKVTATNDIIHGGHLDVDAETDTTTSTTAVTLSHSDFSTHMASGSSGSPSISFNPANTVTAAPQFMNPTHGDYREADGSPTIDKGATDPATETDIVGRPRIIGSAPDIGAYEFLQPPAISHVKTHIVGASSASFTASVNAEGLVTRVRLLAVHGHHQLYSPWISAHNKRVVRHVRLNLGGLAAAQKYAVRVIAANAGGTTTSSPRSVTTR